MTAIQIKESSIVNGVIHVEGMLDCVQGAPFTHADVGNFFEPYFNITPDERKPDKVYSMNVTHWVRADRFLATLQVRRGAAQGYLEVIHSDVHPETRECQNCGMVIGTPRLTPA